MKRICTIGYEGVDIGSFVTTLLAAGVEVVADIRAIPLSRKRGFSKRALGEILREHGIDYLPVSELGDPKPGREAARLKRYDEFRRVYRTHLEGHAQTAALERLKDVARDRSTCLLCFEREPAECHRSMVADRLVAWGFTREDLFVDPLPDAHHADSLPRRHSRQSTASA